MRSSLLTALALGTLPWSCAGISSLRDAYNFEAVPLEESRFRQDTSWRGGDGAYSIDLGGGRVLWLFGDSFVGEGPDNTRAERTMVRNSVAISTTYNLNQLDLAFHYRAEGEKPAAFFGWEVGWLWPGPGLRFDNGLLLTFVRVEEHEGPLGFETTGSAALWVTNPEDSPEQWTWRPVPLPSTPAGVSWGTGALLVHFDYLYAFPSVEPGNHNVYVARWPLSAVSEGTLPEAQWWNGDRWAEPDDAVPVVKGVQTEFSVHRSAYGELWMVSVDGFGGTNVVARTAARPTGPWSKPEVLFRPEESDREGILVYSAKAHPHIGQRDPLATNIPGIYAKGVELVITYCTNHLDFWTMAKDMDLYFPRIVRVRRR